MPEISQQARQQILAFRARRHGLAQRRAATDLLDVVAACGVQDTPPGNADVSLAARLDLDGPIAGEAVAAKRLALTWSLRGAPHVVAPSDLGVFTLGAEPAPGTRAKLWRQPEDALEVVEKAMVRALRAPTSKGELSGRVTKVVPPAYAPYCRGCDVHHPSESVFRAAALRGRIVLTQTSPVELVRANRWLGADATGDVDALRTELLRRYLRCYAPTTPAAFAEWAGISTTDAKQRWETIAASVVAVAGGFVLAEDRDELEQSSGVEGVRLLPAKDAWLQARDRDVLFVDPADRRAVYTAIGGPGVVLVDGEPAGIWRATGKGRRLALRWRPFAARRTVDVEAEAQRVAAVRGFSEAVVAGWD